ncbi:PP2C family protein-serine/threonine phosphatase [Capilliphycus salinus ALCB114379]|uniref:PP2C family protein-serine/threonine phosphatase n=1 Tax=Capilliphycus salinus TaxID=2768948 RepID=UPI0039A7148F
MFRYFSLSQARLSRRVVMVVFASIVIIEGIVLIPSVIRRRQEFFNQIEEVSAGQVKVLIRTIPPNDSESKFFRRIKTLEDQPIHLMGKLTHRIVGGVLYQASSGKVIGTFGEKPKLSYTQVSQQEPIMLFDGNRFDAAWTPSSMMQDYILIFRHDVSTVDQELSAFILRIIGLVLIISLFVTLGVWVALNPLVITPILDLRKDLIKAGDAIKKDLDPPDFCSMKNNRPDELGDVILDFNLMFQKITQAISDRKKAEAALQESLTQVEAYSQALNKELETGREIQRNFLPPELLQKSGWEIAAFFQPARQVAGDFYDVFEFPEGSVGLVIADVCDKGVGAALFMALFRSLIRIFSAQTKLRGSPSKILDDHQPINGWIGESTSMNLTHLNALQAVCLANNYVAEYHGDLGMFATLFFGVLCPCTGLLTYINAGHEPLYILNSEAGIRESLTSTGPAVGMLPDLKFNLAQTYIKPGEILIGYTDGVPEARAVDGSFFTGEKLLSILQKNNNSAENLVQDISDSVQHHTGIAEQFDDITMLAVRRTL